MTFTPTSYDPYDFANRRHIGPSPAEMAEMLKAVGVSSLDELIDQTVPAAIRQTIPLGWALDAAGVWMAREGQDTAWHKVGCFWVHN